MRSIIAPHSIKYLLYKVLWDRKYCVTIYKKLEFEDVIKFILRLISSYSSEEHFRVTRLLLRIDM